MKSNGQLSNFPFPVCKLISVLLLLVAITSTSTALGTIYYVDAASGNDTNDGTSQDTAWKTISKINSTAFWPGDSILLKHGQVWHETLDFWSSGTSDNPITFGAYGTGNKPVLDGSDMATGWEPQGTPNVWYKSGITTNPNMIWLDDAFGKPETSLANLNIAGEYYWNSNTLYLYSTTDPDTAYSTILVGKRDNVIVADNLQYVTFSNLTVSHANLNGVRAITTSDNLIFDGVDTQHNYRHGLMVFLSADSTNIIIRNGDTSYNGGCGVLLSQAAHVTISGYAAHHNCLLEVFQWTAGIRISDVNSYDDIVENNIVYSNGNTTVGDGRGCGIWLDGSGNNNIVRYNKVYGNLHTGIFVEVTSYAQVYYNLVYSNFGYSNARGIAVSGRATTTQDSYPANNNVVYNNTVLGNTAGITVFSDQSGPDTICDNIIKNNISVGNFTQQLYAVDGGQNDGFYGHGNIYQNNCLGEQASNFIQWGSPRYSTYAAWEAVYCGSTGCSNSLQSDPFFVDVSSNNFHLQDTSPAKDKGVNVGLTRDFEGNPVSGLPDLGAFENQAGHGCGPEGDINMDNVVDVNDLGILASHWLQVQCSDSNGWCGGADIDKSSNVDFLDYALLTKNWLTAGNCAPLVNAGLDKSITLSTALNLDGTVLDDGFPNPPGIVTTQWSKQSGPGTVTFDNVNAVDTVAHFSTDGIYVLRLTASDSELSTYDEVTITVTVPQLPSWSINNGTYYVDGRTGSDNNAGTSAAPFATIGKAVSLINGSGKKIVVWGDQTYNEAITANVNGTSGSPHTIIRDPACGSQAIINGGGASNGTIWANSKNYWVIDGFTVTNGNYGIYLYNSPATGWIIKNCRIMGNTGYGIDIRSTANHTIDNCAVYNNGSGNASIYVWNTGATGQTITQSTIYGGYYGIQTATGGASITTLRDCIIWGSQSNAIRNDSAHGCSISPITYCDVANNLNGVTLGTGCKTSNPLLHDPANGDFHLDSGSPAHNTASDSLDMGYRYSTSAL